jgi:Beta propeller domain
MSSHMKTQPVSNGKWHGATWASMAWLGAAMLAGCGGGSGGGASNPGTGLSQAVEKTEATLTASAPGDLVAYAKSKIKQSAAQGAPIDSLDVMVAVASPMAAATAASPAAFAGTRLQEGGVDENDLVKTDGTMLYALSMPIVKVTNGSVTQLPAQLQAQRRLTDGQLAAAGSLVLNDEIDRSGMFLASAAQRLALLGQNRSYYYANIDPVLSVPSSFAPLYKPKIALDLVSLSVPDSLSIAKRVRIDGQLVGSRMIGSTLYLVSTWTPDFRKYIIPIMDKPSEADALLATLTPAEILPLVQIDGQPAEPLLTDTDCYLQTANASPLVQVTTITAFDLASPNIPRSSRCFMGDSAGMYMSPANVYLTSSRYYSVAKDLAKTVFTTSSKTDIHKFALQGQQINYKGSGEVPGHLGWDKDKLSYRMSEYQGDLRVLSFTAETGWWVAPAPGIPAVGAPQATATVNTQAPPSPATLTVLRDNGSQALQVVGSLPNSQRPSPLGHPGEQIHGVQYAGARAYLVTFRRIDPLYVLDVGNPADPKAVGELQMPGFSDYLYPMGDTLLLGVGKDATDTGRVGGVKVALMDVADPTKPSLIKDFVIGKSGSSSALDFSPHGVNIFQQGAVWRVALPVRVHETAQGLGGFYQPTYQGLQRFEVDTSARTLTTKPAINSISFAVDDPYTIAYSEYFIGNDRSVQIDGNVYYFSGGRFLTAGW